MTPREKLDLLKSYRAAGGTGSYVSLIKEAKQYALGGEKTPKELSGPTIRGKKYPKGTIVTNDPNDPRLKAYQDSLSIYKLAPSTGSNPISKVDGDSYRLRMDKVSTFKKGDAKKYLEDVKSYKVYDNGSVSKRKIKDNVYEEVQTNIEHLSGKASSGRDKVTLDRATEDLGDNTFIDSSSRASHRYYNPNISPVGWEDQPVYKKPTQPIVYTPFVNRMQSKGLPESPELIPNERIMPDVVYKDSRHLNAGYTGIDIQHKTDPLGRWAAKMNMSTTPGVRGRLSTPNPAGDYTTKYALGGPKQKAVLPYSPEALASGTPTFHQRSALLPSTIKTKAASNLPELNSFQPIIQEAESTNYISSLPTQDIKIDSTSKARKVLEEDLPEIEEEEKYTVNKGDTLWGIAKKHNTDLATIKRLNPNLKDVNKIQIGDEIAINKKVTNNLPKELNYSYMSPFELDEINQNLDNEDKIHLVEKTTPSSEYYVVEDKTTHTARVYKMGKLVETIDTATGASKGDELTVTYTGGTGRLIGGKGNMKTPAGMFRISSTGTHQGHTSFQRSKINEDYNIPSSVHTGKIPKDKEKCNLSNGCTRITPEGASSLTKYIGKNSRWYILPEEEGSSDFKITGTGLSFISNDPKKLFSEHSKGSRNISIKLPENLQDNQSVKNVAKTLEASKLLMGDKIGISSDTYDKLALMILGIMGRESGFNNPGIRGTYGMVRDEIAGRVLGKNVSAGAFQLRESSIPKGYLKKLTGKDSVEYNDLMNSATASQYVVLSLYDIYKNIAPRYKEKYPDMSLEEITLAYYTNPQGVINPKKSELRKSYAKTALEMGKQFELEYN